MTYQPIEQKLSDLQEEYEATLDQLTDQLLYGANIEWDVFDNLTKRAKELHKTLQDFDFYD